MGSDGAPRVFLSHAWDDKERFVLDFATRLRARGVDVWLDKWEMYPGDSLVDKIFEEGLKNASAVIIVLSNHSIQSKWVREELNAGYVARLAKGTRLIPVVLDGVEVPEALRSTVWIGISDLARYDVELDRIVASVFGQRDKPPLGPPPVFTETTFDVPGVSQQDSQVLKLFCEAAVRKDSLLGISTRETAEGAAEVGIPEAQFLESASVLTEFGFLEKARVVSKVPPYFTVTHRAFDVYVRQAVPEYNDVLLSVISEVVNNDKKYDRLIMQSVGRTDFLLVEHVLHVLESNGFVKLSKAIGRHTYIHDVSPRLRRLLESGGA